VGKEAERERLDKKITSIPEVVLDVLGHCLNQWNEHKNSQRFKRQS